VTIFKHGDDLRQDQLILQVCLFVEWQNVEWENVEW
jgi:hypothetical protein